MNGVGDIMVDTRFDSRRHARHCTSSCMAYKSNELLSISTTKRAKDVAAQSVEVPNQ